MGTCHTPTIFFYGGTMYPHFFRLNNGEDNRFALSYETSRNGFRDYIDNNGENVPEELKQVFMCVDSLPVSTADC